MADQDLSIYDQIEIEDMTFDPTLQLYTFPCPCGDRFEILLDDLREGQDIAVCPSCSLMIQVIFEPVRSVPERPAAGLFFFSSLLTCGWLRMHRRTCPMLRRAQLSRWRR